MIDFVFNSSSVQVVNSHEVHDPNIIRCVTRGIVGDERCPQCLRLRGVDSLCQEWMGHNLLYEWNILRSHTADVDFDDEPGWRKAGYWVLSLIYQGLWRRFVRKQSA